MPTHWREPSAPGETTRTHHRTGEECELEIEEPSGLQRYGITALARRQLAEKLKIPYAYFERMRTEEPEFLDRNVNAWLVKEEGERQLLRTLDGRVRAVLSERYRCKDCKSVAPCRVRHARPRQGRVDRRSPGDRTR